VSFSIFIFIISHNNFIRNHPSRKQKPELDSVWIDGAQKAHSKVEQLFLALTVFLNFFKKFNGFLEFEF